MSGALEGVQIEPGCQITQISAKQWGAAVEERRLLVFMYWYFSTAYGYGKGGQM